MSLATVGFMTAHRRKTPLRTLQVEDALWRSFGDSAEQAGTTRPDALREFMDWLVADPDLWAAVRKTAEDRGQTMRAAVLGQLRSYLTG